MLYILTLLVPPLQLFVVGVLSYLGVTYHKHGVRDLELATHVDRIVKCPLGQFYKICVVNKFPCFIWDSDCHDLQQCTTRDITSHQFIYISTFKTLHYTINSEISALLTVGLHEYYSVQTLLSSRLLSKNIKIKIYKTIILPVVKHGLVH